jgi:hypothetical protein
MPRQSDAVGRLVNIAQEFAHAAHTYREARERREQAIRVAYRSRLNQGGHYRGAARAPRRHQSRHGSAHYHPAAALEAAPVNPARAVGKKVSRAMDRYWNFAAVADLKTTTMPEARPKVRALKSLLGDSDLAANAVATAHPPLEKDVRLELRRSHET